MSPFIKWTGDGSSVEWGSHLLSDSLLLREKNPNMDLSYFILSAGQLALSLCTLPENITAPSSLSSVAAVPHSYSLLSLGEPVTQSPNVTLAVSANPSCKICANRYCPQTCCWSLLVSLKLRSLSSRDTRKHTQPYSQFTLLKALPTLSS